MTARKTSAFFSTSLAAGAGAAVLLAPIPAVYGALIVAAVATGLFWDLRDRHFIPRRFLTALGLAGFLFTLLPFSRETLAEQALAALSILLSVKLLEGKKRRDHLQILTLAAIITVGAGSLAPEMIFGALVLLVTLLGTGYLLWLPFSELEEAQHRPGLLRRLAVTAGGMVAIAIPLTFVLFVILPRSVNPFWGGLAPAQRKVSGFSEQINLGEVGKLALSREVAFRAEIVGAEGPLGVVPYWRGISMEETDGRRWRSTPGAVAVRGYPSEPAVRVVYYVEPHGEHQLFLLEQPAAAFMGFRMQPLSEDATLRLRAPLTKRIRYQGLSLPAPTRSGTLTAEQRRQNLSLPDGLSPQVRDLARRLAGEGDGPEAKASLLLDFFRSGFTYSLESPPPAADPLEDFLLRRRTGYCEYFASALAVMLRSVGVPARLVAGYLGGDYNENGNYYLVTQSAAHTWVEAYLGERGWTRLDPTPAAGELGGTFAARNAPRPSLWLDSLRMKWNSWVVQYDAEVQVDLAKTSVRRLLQLRLPRPDIDRLPYLLLPLLLAGLLLLAGRRRLEGAADPVAARYKRFNAIMARKGIERRPHEGPLDFGRRVALLWPDGAWAVRSFTGLYARLHYGGWRVERRDLADLDTLLRSLTR